MPAKTETDDTLGDIQQIIADYAQSPTPFRLNCSVQHYDWGGLDFIPNLLSKTNPQRQPFAEIWIGAHPELPARAIIGQKEIPLDILISQVPEHILGSTITKTYQARLPFLLKILSARQPLSIQAHPNQKQAKQGFELENNKGIPINDKARNYKDDNHKPELIAALTEFYALRGFRDENELLESLTSIPEFSGLIANFQANRTGLIDLYSNTMQMGQSEVDAILTPLIERLKQENSNNSYKKHQRGYWVLEADRIFSSNSDEQHKDRGIFSIFFLNLVCLQAGQAMYLPAGELHAYLEGSGVEIMANSNNVLRGGLTGKNVDVPELLATLAFDSGQPEIIYPQENPQEPVVKIYNTSAVEFQLSQITLTESDIYDISPEHGVHIAIVLEGRVNLRCNASHTEYKAGEVFLVPYGIAYQLSTKSGTLLYRAEVP